jgi:tetrahydromethanopterin S-methyltransferase subunit E
VTALPPTPAPGYGKAIAATAAACVSTILVYVIDQFLKAPLPAEMVAAIQGLLTVGAVYFTPHGGDQ